MPKITFNITFYGGKGSVIFDGDGIDPHTEISSDNVPTSLSADQASGNQRTAVSGTIPFGDAANPGQVTIEVISDDQVLSPASKNTFSPKMLSGQLKYTFTVLLDYDI